MRSISLRTAMYVFRIEPPLAVMPCRVATVEAPTYKPPTGVEKVDAATPTPNPAITSLATPPKAWPTKPPDKIS